MKTQTHDNLYVAPFLQRRAGRAFTLIELLVVVSIIALLVSILMPALGRARAAAKNSVCASNLHQIGLATVMYESDAGRMPIHVTEMRGKDYKWHPNQVSWNFGGTKYDVRDDWIDYLDVNFFNCPFLPESDYGLGKIPVSQKRIYINYVLCPGFYHKTYDDLTEEWSDDAWVKSESPWRFGGRKMNVIAGDLMQHTPGGSTSVNHVSSAGAFQRHEVNLESGKEYVINTYLAVGYIEDPREEVTANYVFTDGSVANFRGSDPQLLEVPPVSVFDKGVNFLLPADR